MRQHRRPALTTGSPGRAVSPRLISLFVQPVAWNHRQLAAGDHSSVPTGSVGAWLSCGALRSCLVCVRGEKLLEDRRRMGVGEGLGFFLLLGLFAGYMFYEHPNIAPPVVAASMVVLCAWTLLNRER